MNREPSSAITSRPPEERAAVDRARDPHVERLVELDALRDAHEQAVLPERRVVRRELLVPPTSEPSRSCSSVSGSKVTPSGARSISIPLSLIVASPARRGRASSAGASGGPPFAAERVGVEALQVGEAPVPPPSCREAAARVALEASASIGLRSRRRARTFGAGSARCRRDRGRTRCGRRRSRRSRRELDALRLELRARGRDVGDAKRDRGWPVGTELQPEPIRTGNHDQAERDGPGLELRRSPGAPGS